MSKLIAYHGDPAIREKYLARVHAHAKADRIRQGVGWNGSHGCAIGCTLEGYNHSQYEIELGVPVQIAWIEDTIFEGLPTADAMRWPARFLSAIRPGADLALVWVRFLLALLEDPRRGVIRFILDPKFARQQKAVQAVISLYRNWVACESHPLASEAESAVGEANVAWSAALATGTNAVCAALLAAYNTAHAAWNTVTAESAARSAAGAARSAARAESTGSAESAAYRWQASLLLRLLRAAPYPSYRRVAGGK